MQSVLSDTLAKLASKDGGAVWALGSPKRYYGRSNKGPECCLGYELGTSQY